MVLVNEKGKEKRVNKYLPPDPQNIEKSKRLKTLFYFEALLWAGGLDWFEVTAVVITRNRPAISVKDGRAVGLGAQHSSINILQSESQ